MICEKCNIKLGSKGEDVKLLQKYLTYYGYYDSKIDGDCGKYTVESIKKFQKDNRLLTDGVFGKISCQKSKIVSGNDISSSNKTIVLKTWKDIINRYNTYIKNNGKEPNICYINKEYPFEYITNTKYKDILSRYNKWIKEKGEEPNFVYINKTENNETVNPIIITSAPQTTSDNHKVASVFVKLYTKINENDIQQWKNAGITDVMVQVSAQLDDTDKLRETINYCKNTNIKVHAWVLCFKYDGKWINTKEQETLIKKYIEKVIKIQGVQGICLDYVRYSGVNPNYTRPDVITNFVKDVNTLIKKYDSSLKLSACVFAEKGGTKAYYGQDYVALSKYLDYIMPMAYKYSYTNSSEWLYDAVKYVVDKSSKAKVVAIIQTYNGEDTTKMLGIDELRTDINTIMKAGSYGYSLFYKTAIKEYPKIEL